MQNEEEEGVSSQLAMNIPIKKIKQMVKNAGKCLLHDPDACPALGERRRLYVKTVPGRKQAAYLPPPDAPAMRGGGLACTVFVTAEELRSVYEGKTGQ